MAAAKRTSSRRRSTSSGSGYDQIVHDASEYYRREQGLTARAEMRDVGPDRVLSTKRSTVYPRSGATITTQNVRKNNERTSKISGGKPASKATRVPRSSGPASMKSSTSASSRSTRSKVTKTSARGAIRGATPRAGSSGGRGNTGGRIGMARGMGRGGSAGKRHGK